MSSAGLEIGLILDLEKFKQFANRVLDDYVRLRRQLQSVVMRIDSCLSLDKARREESDDDDADLDFAVNSARLLQDLKGSIRGTLERTTEG